MNNVAKFLESRGMPEQALEVATDADYRFELAVTVMISSQHSRVKLLNTRRQVHLFCDLAFWETCLCLIGYY